MSLPCCSRPTRELALAGDVALGCRLPAQPGVGAKKLPRCICVRLTEAASKLPGCLRSWNKH